MQEKITNENTFGNIAAFHLEKACEHIRMCEVSIQSYLSDIVASLCDIEKEKMFTATDVVFIAHARWFYWYCYRYMTKESYDKIAMQDFHNQHKFNARTVQNAVSKMSMMIDSEPLWRKRWLVVKQLIKIYNGEESEKPIMPITIQIPKELKGIVKVEIKEK